MRIAHRFQLKNAIGFFFSSSLSPISRVFVKCLVFVCFHFDEQTKGFSVAQNVTTKSKRNDEKTKNGKKIEMKLSLNYTGEERRTKKSIHTHTHAMIHLKWNNNNNKMYIIIYDVLILFIFDAV